jgi:NAD(P)-dependent dehydrogenase (short-subunit alcohol dehydrogenase family)
MRSNTMKNIAAGAAAVLAIGKLTMSVLARRRGMRLDGKVAVVCGGSRGLGLAVARALAAKGCNIAICGRNAGHLDDARREIGDVADVAVYAEPCDLRRPEDVDRFLSNVVAHMGPIDLLVTNAATISVAPIETLDVHDFEQAMDDIFRTALHPALAVIPSMRARGTGTIAFVTSIGGKIGVPHLAPYSAAKFAEVGLAQALRAELAKDGVHVLTVVPGLMRTGSPVHATFKGAAEKEYAWFAASANAPLLSIDPDRAAHHIVTAIERGDTELTYTPAARIASRMHDVAPSLFDEALALAGRLLPSSNDVTRARAREGIDIENDAQSPVIEAVKKRNRAFARRHGQLRSP